MEVFSEQRSSRSNDNLRQFRVQSSLKIDIPRELVIPSSNIELLETVGQGIYCNPKFDAAKIKHRCFMYHMQSSMMTFMNCIPHKCWVFFDNTYNFTCMYTNMQLL